MPPSTLMCIRSVFQTTKQLEIITSGFFIYIFYYQTSEFQDFRLWCYGIWCHCTVTIKYWHFRETCYLCLQHWRVSWADNPWYREKKTRTRPVSEPVRDGGPKLCPLIMSLFRNFLPQQCTDASMFIVAPFTRPCENTHCRLLPAALILLPASCAIYCTPYTSFSEYFPTSAPHSLLWLPI